MRVGCGSGYLLFEHYMYYQGEVARPPGKKSLVNRTRYLSRAVTLQENPNFSGQRASGLAITGISTIKRMRYS